MDIRRLKSSCLKVVLVSALLALCGPVFAQTTTGDAASGVGAQAVANTNTSSASQSIASQGNGNAQSSTNIFQGTNVPTHTTETVRTAPSMSIGSFGTSFSSDNCANTVAGAISVIGVGASGGKAVLETTCAHLRVGYAFGQSAAFSKNVGDQKRASEQQAMSDLAFCTALPSDPSILKGCQDLGLVAASSDDKRRTNAAAYVSPQAQQQRETIYSDRPALADGTIPSRPSTWTGVAGQSGVPPTEHH